MDPQQGFSLDATSPDSYREILDALPLAGPLPPAQRERALRYAYHFFFRRMIELPFLADAGPAEFDIQADSLAELAPGRHGGLDRICDGLLTARPSCTTPGGHPRRRRGGAGAARRPSRPGQGHRGLGGGIGAAAIAEIR